MAAQNVMAQFEKLRANAEQLLWSRNEAGKIRVQVGSATCENAAGATAVWEEFRRYIAASGRNDIVLRQTGCTGRCSCEPIVSVFVPGTLPVIYERVNAALAHRIFIEHLTGGAPIREHTLEFKKKQLPRYEFLLCDGVRCERAVMPDLEAQIETKLEARGLDPAEHAIIRANCFGLCAGEMWGRVVHLMVRPTKIIYRLYGPQDLDRVIDEHIVAGHIVKDLVVADQPMSQRFFEMYGDASFFNLQSRVALRNSGVINPEDINEYLFYDGFRALATVLDKGDPRWVIDQVTKSRLRGRGGAGYPTGQKWLAAANAKEKTRYMLCNADEGDPGAFMDRSMLEGDPFSVIEGMTIAAFAIGAKRGFFYIRAEYPMAIARVQKAIEVCRSQGLLGKRVLGGAFEFDLDIRLGAGAFVCGEETALIHSIEGERGQPRIRPPYPAERGLWGKPTVINNVETLANVPAIFLYSPEWFASIGTAQSGGTKVFALAGKVRHTGLVEVPMGSTLRQVVCEIGGGVREGKQIKAIQTGGPSGGCIPAQFLDTVVDYGSLAALGASMGSGGMIVMDDDDCMVDIAKFFLGFSQDESCGKCTPCREGTTRMLEILERITTGKGVPEDIVKLERLAKLVRKASLCGLGRTAPNPVLSTLKYFRAEYEAHINEKRCPAGKCVALVRYAILAEKCAGCTACARNCPVACIAGAPKKVHAIDQARCIRCGRCFQVCRFNAVSRS